MVLFKFIRLVVAGGRVSLGVVFSVRNDRVFLVNFNYILEFILKVVVFREFVLI